MSVKTMFVWTTPVPWAAKPGGHYESELKTTVVDGVTFLLGVEVTLHEPEEPES